MTEIKSRSQMPIWIGLGFLLITIVAAYYYQTKKSVEGLMSSEEQINQENALKEVENSIFELNPKGAVEQTSVSKDAFGSIKEGNSEAKEPKPEAEKVPNGPSLKTVLVDSDGAVVMAGRGLPNQKIDILLDDEVIETVFTDKRGDFAVSFDLPYSAKMRVLSLKSNVDDEFIYSREEVIISPAQIAEPIVIAQTDTNDESGLVTSLEQNLDLQESELEPQSAKTVTSSPEKTKNLRHEVDETKLSKLGTVSSDAKVGKTDIKDRRLIKTAKEPNKIGRVEETEPEPQSADPATMSSEKTNHLRQEANETKL